MELVISNSLFWLTLSQFFTHMLVFHIRLMIIVTNTLVPSLPLAQELSPAPQINTNSTLKAQQNLSSELIAMYKKYGDILWTDIISLKHKATQSLPILFIRITWVLYLSRKMVGFLAPSKLNISKPNTSSSSATTKPRNQSQILPYRWNVGWYPHQTSPRN